jgi:hypothetical protein
MNDDARKGFRPADFGGLIGPMWLVGWMFTPGFVGLSHWKAVLALVLWPYLLGVAAR